jgi:hypothetical protein
VKTAQWLPQHWPLELPNGLMMAERRQRIDAGRRRQLAEFLRDLPIILDPDTAIQVWGATQGLAERFRILAQRKCLSLASLYNALCRAATELGVPVLGTSSAYTCRPR